VAAALAAALRTQRNVGATMQDRLISLFRETFGVQPVSAIPLQGDASARAYSRLTGPDGRTVIGAVGSDQAENRAFVSHAAALRRAGVHVPEVHAYDDAAGVYLQEDLGSVTLFGALSAAREVEGVRFPASLTPVYEKVVQELPRIQVAGGREIDDAVCYPRAAFDRQSIAWDLQYFKYDFLKLARAPFNESRLERDFEALTAFLLQTDRTHFLYRDFQSRNILIRDGEPWFIDFQGGRRGALQYDIASLLYDGKADIPDELRGRLLDRYLDALAELVPVDPAAFAETFRGYVLIRICQALGTYGYRGFFEHKPHFLASVPYAVANLESILEGPGMPLRLPELERIFRWMIRSRELRQAPEALTPTLTVLVSSFAYRQGYPADSSGHGGGFVFDTRCLPNPGRDPENRLRSGLDREVRIELESSAEVAEFWVASRQLVDTAVSAYLKRGFTNLSVAFGCTGGQHRSVYFADRLAGHLRERFPGVAVHLVHREQDRWGQQVPAEATAQD
jgi:aminoglycoside/choline kinase family phosphotransferase